MVQEYGRYFDMPTCCLRGGCLTGPNHSGVELHGFLSYLVKCNLEGREYKVFGYKGKQVRDNIHSLDVARFMRRLHRGAAGRRGLQSRRRQGELLLDPRGVQDRRGVHRQAQMYTYVDQNRIGDHICYYSRPAQNARALPRLGHHPIPRGDDPPDRGGAARAEMILPPGA